MEARKSIQIAKEIERYFGLDIIGSYLFVTEGLLAESDVNDIDILSSLHNKHVIERVSNYLKDKGFEVKESTHTNIRFSHPEYDKIIDINLNQSGTMKKKTIPELISDKFELGRLDDLKQLSKIIENKKQWLNQTPPQET